MVQKLNHNLTETVVLDGFKPPVAARIYAYANIAGYECLRHLDTTYKSLQGQLPDLDSLPVVTNNADYNWEVAAIIAFSKAATEMTFRDYQVEQYRDTLLLPYKKQLSEDVYKRSAEAGEQTGRRVITALRKDGYGLTRTLEKYMVKAADDKWKPTPPKYTDACEPFWFQIKAFTLDSVSEFLTGPPPAFSTGKNSAFYQFNQQLLELTNNLTDEQKAIGNYWDDNPAPLSLDGHLMETYKQISPGGHWITIANQVCRHEKKSLVETSAITTVVAIAVSDGFKSCWHSKFYYETLRPVTYINKYITTTWQPLIETPMFPEYPSAHSTITAAAATVLEHYFGDSYAFTDSTEIPYNKGARQFSSFHDAARECGLSRVYGGIHYIFSCDTGLVYGHKIGNHVLAEIKTNN